MKKLTCVIAFALSGTLSAFPASADDGLFTGDTRLACEAILCLASGNRPDECSPSLKRYFSIRHRKPSDTIKARRNFLKMCPAAEQDDAMRTLVNDIANGAGRCDAASLNASNMIWNDGENRRFIANAAPRHCLAYQNNPYTDLTVTAARYVGEPGQGGYWVDGAGYEQALREYNARRARQGGLHGGDRTFGSER